MALPYKEEKHGNWQNVSELVDFKIIKLAPQSLLGVGKADVMLLYKKKSGEDEKDQKRLIIFGPEDAVYQRALDKIKEKKNPAKAAELQNKFIEEWKATDYEKPSSSKGFQFVWLKKRQSRGYDQRNICKYKNKK